MEEEQILTEEEIFIEPQLSEEELQNQQYRQLRRQANIQGGALMIYKGILNVAVYAVMLVAAVAAVLTGVLLEAFSQMAPEAPEPNLDAVGDVVAEAMNSAMGWGYLLAVAIGWLILRLWKKKAFFKNEIYKPGKPMTIGAFFTLVAIVFGIQVPAQLWSMGLEWICNQFDLYLLEILEENSMDMDNIAIWLYVCLAAPITEELLFRGLVLRSVQPYGKKFAILVSSILFGLYHGSPIQTPYAIVVGLVLGYVAVEYNVIWAMVLHMMNNLLLSDTLPRLLECLPYQLGDTLLWIVLIICAVAGLILLLLRHSEVKTWCQAETMPKWQRKAFWRSPCIIILTIWCLLDLGMYFLIMFL